MKTTVEIPDALLEQVRRPALVEEGLRKVLEARRNATRGFKMRHVVFHGDGLHPELEGASWETIRDLIYEGHGT